MTWTQRLVAGARGLDYGIALMCNGLLIVTGLIMLALLTVVVVLRYVFHSGLSFAPDLTELMFGIFVMSGIVLAACRGVHVATQLLINYLQGSARLALALFIHAVTAGIYLLLAWYALQNAIIAHDQTTPVLQIPWSVGYGVLAGGLMLVCVSSITAMIRHGLGGEPVIINLADPGGSAA
ncbi:TRAP transporter small permease [Leptospira interrogans]